MNDQLMKFGGGGGTVLNPFVIGFMCVASLLMFVLPRKYLLVPLFVTIFFIPMEQKVVIAGLHFMMYRIILMVAWARVLKDRIGFARFRSNSVDKAVILWTLSGVITFTLLWQEWGAFVVRMGWLYNTFGTYFLLRLLYQSEEDVNRSIKIFAVVCTILAICMLNEQITGRNLFSVFGGLPTQTSVREGKLRSQGAFAHPILAGVFGAILMPLFAKLWWGGRQHRLIAATGFASSTVIMLTSASSTPLLAYAAGTSALLFWSFRRYTRLLRWGALICLVGLHMVMKAPVWSLIARVDVVQGNSSYHRYQLVDQCIRHFGEWWLLGTRSNSSWGFEMGDTANTYVDTAVTGGLITLILLIVVIVFCYKRLGIARRRSATISSAKGTWALGAALSANLVAFFGIAYFDQTVAAWYTLLAMIAATPVLVRRELAPSEFVTNSQPQLVSSPRLASVEFEPTDNTT